MLLLTAETNSKVTSAFNFIPSKFWSFLQEVWKVVLHTGLNVHRETPGGSRFVTNSLLVCYKCLKRIPSSYTSMVFPVTSTKAHPIPIQNNIHSWVIEIKEIPKYKLHIGDLSKTAFWYHSNDTKRNPWVMLCSHCPINDPSGYLHITVYLAVMLQAPWYTAEGN